MMFPFNVILQLVEFLKELNAFNHKIVEYLTNMRSWVGFFKTFPI